jgi:hypothetical protein
MTDIPLVLVSFDANNELVDTQAVIGDNLRSQSWIKLFFVPTNKREELFGTNKIFVADSLDFDETMN